MQLTVLFAILLFTSQEFAKCEPVLEDIRYVGCFDTEYSFKEYYLMPFDNGSLANCVSRCVDKRTRYAGVNGDTPSYCLCGGDIYERSHKRNDSLCNVSCSDDGQRTCGGEEVLSLYDISDVITERPGFDETDNVDILIGFFKLMKLCQIRAKLDTCYTVMHVKSHIDSLDYHLSKKLVFASMGEKLYKSLMKPNLTESELQAILVAPLSNCSTFAVDWQNDKIYWVDCTERDTSIMVMGLDGTNVASVFIKPENMAHITKLELDPIRGMLFWLADGIIESYELPTAEFRTNLSNPEVNVRALTLDTASEQVYYVGSHKQTSSLYNMAYNGTGRIEHFSLQELEYLRINLGYIRNKVYWTQGNWGSNLLYRAPVELLSVGEVWKLMDVPVIHHMKIIDPELQKRSSEDPCENRGCSHFCITESSAHAHCQCLPGYDLHAGVSCIASEKQEVIPCTNSTSMAKSSVASRSHPLVSIPAVSVIILLYTALH